MKKYEGMFLLDHGKVKSDLQKGMDAITGLLEKHGAKVAQIGKWDERKLAYEINKQKRGTYVLTRFEAEEQAIGELRRDIELNEVISRHIIIRLHGEEFPPFMTATDLEAKYGTRDFRDRGRRGPRSDDRRDRESRRPSAPAAGPAADEPAAAPAGAPTPSATPDQGDSEES